MDSKNHSMYAFQFVKIDETTHRCDGTNFINLLYRNISEAGYCVRGKCFTVFVKEVDRWVK